MNTPRVCLLDVRMLRRNCILPSPHGIQARSSRFERCPVLHSQMTDSDSHRGRIPLLALAILLVVAALTISAEAGFAQEPTPTPIVMQPVTRPVTDPLWLLGFTIATLIFALIAMALLLNYMQQAQARFYAVSEALGRAGRTVRVTSTPPFTTGRQEGLAAAGQRQGCSPVHQRPRHRGRRRSLRAVRGNAPRRRSGRCCDLDGDAPHCRDRPAGGSGLCCPGHCASVCSRRLHPECCRDRPDGCEW